MTFTYLVGTLIIVAGVAGYAVKLLDAEFAMALVSFGFWSLAKRRTDQKQEQVQKQQLEETQMVRTLLSDEARQRRVR